MLILLPCICTVYKRPFYLLRKTFRIIGIRVKQWKGQKKSGVLIIIIMHFAYFMVAMEYEKACACLELRCAENVLGATCEKTMEPLSVQLASL
jgi:hypothetical protein